MSLAPREEASALGLQWRVYEKVGLLVAKLNLQMPNTTLQGYDYRYRHAKHLDVQHIRIRRLHVHENGISVGMDYWNIGEYVDHFSATAMLHVD